MIMNKTIMKCMVLGLLFAGCENGDKEFDDYEYQTISFATQTPIRTITLGEDVYPTEQDNEYRMQIIATLGGVWSNRKERTAQIVIDESLCTNAYFDNGKPILPMPKEYYTYSSEQVVFPKGDIYGRMDIQLTDAFFNDPLTPELTYVIPVRLAQASDSILAGKPKVESAEKIVRTVKATGAIVSGPIPLPTHKRIFTVNRSTFVNKKSREQFELSSYKRLIDIYSSTAKTVDALMKLELPSGVEVEIKV